ncbi:MAG TPA: type IV toxin-antitoxin system AbiEi family antitoxin domain-containing protein [Hyphomonas sp.]|nr:hypothetical protein [Hyphomonas sp.]HRJ01754.1 type IV toxin-antitoxin system AbiEi family antitoxin domain-containing protein [Hyphomonas sp.]
MNEQKRVSLKQLLALLPPGAYVDSRWLTAHGVLRSSLAQYTKAGWLNRVAHGLYQRPETPAAAQALPADWRAVILAAQALMGYPLHIGGMTALREAGHSHDLTFGPRPVHLYGASIPGWLRKLPTDEPLRFHTTHAFGDSPVSLGPDTATAATDELASPWWKSPLRVAEPERAILESLDELPEGESFTTLDRVFESLVALRPHRLESAIEACTSVKAKRLFFVFAERHGHSWLKHLDTARVDLGKGDRSLVKGGKLHPTWRITVPAGLLAPASETRHGG